MKNDLIQLLGAENVVFNNDSMEEPYKLSASCIVTPENEAQVAALLKWAAERSVRLVPQGGGTKDALGLCSVSADIIVSMTKLSGIIHHSVGDLIVTVLPGTTLQELQDVLSREGQFLPIDAAHAEQVTLGGIVAANGSGPKRALYGSVRDFLIASRVACTDGTIIRTGAKVVKNVAGYDMNKLFIGAMGTLGIFTELTFKIRPIPTASGMIVLFASTPEKLKAFQAALLDSHLEPCAFEIVNSAVGESFMKGKSSAIFVLFEDVEQSVHYQLDVVRELIKQLDIEEIHTYRGRESTEPPLEWLRSTVPNTNYLNEDRVIVGLKLASSISDVPDIFQFIESFGLNGGLNLRFHGGLSTGICHVSLSADSHQEENVTRWVMEVRTYLEQRKGYAILECASKRMRSAVSTWGKQNEGVELMRGIKQKFDPAHILNYGRYLGGV